MKLLITTAVVEHREQLQEIFSTHKVPYYNEMEMKGVRRLKDQHRLGNWFGTGTIGLENIAFVALMFDEQAKGLYEELVEFEDSSNNKIFSAYILDVDKANEIN